MKKDDLIQKCKQEFRNEKVIRESKYKTEKDRAYAKGWNACNNAWINAILNDDSIN